MGFWQVACLAYQKDGVEAQLLKLQDQYGLVVNHLLLAVYLVKTQQTVEWLEIFSKERDSQFQSTLMKPLRAFRRASKATMSDYFYQMFKSLELSVERVHIDWLEQQVANVDGNCQTGSSFSREQLTDQIQRYLAAATSLGALSIDAEDTELSLLINGFISAVTS